MTVKFAQHTINLLGISHVLPNEVVTTDSLLNNIKQECGSIAARKAHFIAKRLGIESRYFARDFIKHPIESRLSPTSIELSVTALNRALNMSQLDVNQLDYLLSHTCTPHTQVPPNAAWVSDELAYQGAYLELRQACTGFANALQIASAFCASNTKPVAIIGCETGSAYFKLTKEFVDTEQMVNLVQMGDGAAAIVLANNTSDRQRISDIYLGQIGHNKAPGFYLDSGSNDVGQTSMARFHHNIETVKQQGSQLFELGLEAVLSRGYQLSDFRYILPHQANGHIDTLLSSALGLEADRIINDAKSLGNLGSAAIWVSLARLIDSNVLQRGDKVLVLGAEATKYLYGGFVYQH